MKKLFRTLVLMSLFNTQYSFVNAQNLVPNPSFEDTVQCPTPFSQLEFSSGWINPNSYSPDYFHSCANLNNPNYGIPTNEYGFQNARTGIAYAGIYLPVNSGTDSREYIQIELSDTLTAGLSYVVKFYVSLADSSVFSVNSIGAFLSDTVIQSSTSTVFNVVPQVINNYYLNPLTDFSVWYEIADTIIALGGEQFITIGNFEVDSIADTTNVSGGSSISNASYYYIDDVSVELYPVGISEHWGFSDLIVYPNPTSDNVKISLSNEDVITIQIINIVGEIVYEEQKFRNNSTINTNKIPSGIYYIKIITNNNIILNKNKLIITK